MCLHGALCPIPFNLICNMTMGAGSAVKYLLQRCCICSSLQFDMQHDHVLNKLTFDHRVRGAGRVDLLPKYLHVAAFAILFNFICNINMFSIS